MEGVGRVTDRSESVTDMTVQYTDNQTRLETLYAKRERLNQLMAQAQEVSDLIELETAVADTQYEIERYETSQRDIDRRVDMSAVNVTLLEERPRPERNGGGYRPGRAPRRRAEGLVEMAGRLPAQYAGVCHDDPAGGRARGCNRGRGMAGCAQTVPARPEGWFQGGVTHETAVHVAAGRLMLTLSFAQAETPASTPAQTPVFHSGGRSHGRPGNHHPCHGHGECVRCRRILWCSRCACRAPGIR